MAVKGYDSLIDQLNRLMQPDAVMVATLSTVLAAQKKRIFQQGKSAEGAKIGSYSTKPISISRKNQARNTGRTHFPGGYRQYKSLTGKGSGFVNLRNTDQMMMDYGVHVVGLKQYGLGFNNEFNFDKSNWNEDHFDKEIFAESDAEDRLFQRVFEYEINRI